jgi:serine O-acetyltransferase
MTLRDSLKFIYSDYRRYRATGRGQGSPLGVVLLTQGFWASTVYRLSHWVEIQEQLGVIRLLLRMWFLFWQKLIEMLTGISIPATCQIGEGLYVGHFGHLIVNGKVQMGANCNLSQGVTLGMKRDGNNKGVPTLGDRVYVGPNAVIIGEVHVGNDAVIGAGAIVTKSVPAAAVVAGNPATVISNKGSFNLVRYDGMESDPARNEAIKNRESLDIVRQ